MFYHHIHTALDDPHVRRNALEALNDRSAARQRFPKACRDAAARAVGSDNQAVPHAAYCFAVQLLEGKGVTDKGMFRQVAKDLGLPAGTDQ